MSRVTFSQQALGFCCGVTELGEFGLDYPDDFHYTKPVFNEKKPWEYDGWDKKPDDWTETSTRNTRYNFEDDLAEWEQGNTSAKVEQPGTGIFTATFVNNEECKAAYDEFTSKHRLLFQTHPTVNTSSGNEVFLCVFEWLR